MESKTGLDTEATVAELFGVTDRRIRQLAQKKIIPKAGKGLYDFKPTAQAYIRYLHGLANGAISADTDELHQHLLQAQTDERVAKARMAELELSVMQGRLHEADHVKKIMIDMIVACRSRLLAIPSKSATTIANMTDHVEIASHLRGLIYEALEALSEYDAEKFNELNEKYVPPYIDESSEKTDI